MTSKADSFESCSSERIGWMVFPVRWSFALTSVESTFVDVEFIGYFFQSFRYSRPLCHSLTCLHETTVQAYSPLRLRSSPSELSRVSAKEKLRWKKKQLPFIFNSSINSFSSTLQVSYLFFINPCVLANSSATVTVAFFASSSPATLGFFL